MMAKMGAFSAKDLKNLQKQLNKIKQEDMEEFMSGCAKELAARLLAAVIPRTPVGDYSQEIEVVAKRNSKKHKKGDVYIKTVTTKQGGTLRRGWTAKTHEEAASGNGKKTVSLAEAQAWAESLKVSKSGNMISVEIINPVEYASYVEYGHRTASHKGWVTGKFMLTISENEIRGIAPRVIENRVKKFLGETFK